MIASLPIYSALLQVKPKVDFDLNKTSSARLIGGSGFVGIIAPLPPSDSTELPYMFIATIFA
jgi:hypothetical protein